MRNALLICFALLGCREQPRESRRTVPIARVSPSCDGARLLEAPADLAAPGPWTVGVRTIRIGEVVTEVWYPARGTTRTKVRYDLRDWMPADERAKVPDPVWLPCDCDRDLPIDDRHGPYPVVLFLHGAAAFRVQSTSLAVHWASRGFITIAPDLPGIGMFALLGGESMAFPSGIPLELLDAIVQRPEADDPLGSLRPHIGSGIAIVGHSLGAMLALTTAARDEIRVRIALAGAADLSASASHLVVAGGTDGVAAADPNPRRLDGARAPARSAIIAGAGHLAFTDLCAVGADRGGVLAIAREHGVPVPAMVATLATDGCRPSDAPSSVTAPILKSLTTGVLEETLRCDRARTAQIAALGRGGSVDLVEVLDAK